MSNVSTTNCENKTMTLLLIEHTLAVAITLPTDAPGPELGYGYGPVIINKRSSIRAEGDRLTRTHRVAALLSYQEVLFTIEVASSSLKIYIVTPSGCED